LLSGVPRGPLQRFRASVFGWCVAGVLGLRGLKRRGESRALYTLEAFERVEGGDIIVRDLAFLIYQNFLINQSVLIAGRHVKGRCRRYGKARAQRCSTEWRWS
jgi:hypothetical protein